MSVLDIERPIADNSVVAMLQNSVLLSLTIGSFGNVRKLSTSQIEVDADKAMIGANKKLLDSPELKAITSLDGKVRAWLYTRSVPGPFGPGIYLVPLSLVQEVEEKLAEFQIQRVIRVAEFLGVYESTVAEAQVLLRSTFRPSDYPPIEVVRSRFVLDWMYVSMSAPETLPPSLLAREQEKYAEKFTQAFGDIQVLLRSSMSELVDHLVDTLSGTADGKKKKFYDTTLTKLQDFLTTFEARNLANDADLDSLVQQARNLVDGMDPATIKKNASVQDAVKSGFTAIQQQLDSMMTERPSRKITFEGD